MGAGRQIAAQSNDASSYAEIAARVVNYTGMAAWLGREDFLAGKVDERMRILGLSSYADYLKRVTSPESLGEWDALIETVAVGETYFWRYPAQWDALRDIVLPERRKMNKGAGIRVWCAGCANGAEPYTLTILLRRHAPDLLADGGVQIFATDISRTRLEKAVRGVFSDWDLRALPEPLRGECFSPEGARWRLREEYRRGVRFHHHNLTAFEEEFHKIAGDPFDVILCRNVMIYFSAELIRRLLRSFHHRLADGGWLLTGHAEPYLEISNVFVPVAAPGVTLYRKIAVAGESAPIADVGPKPAPVAPPVATPKATRKEAQAAHRLRARTPSSLTPVHGADAGGDAAQDARGLENARRLANEGAWSDVGALCRRRIERDPINPDAHFMLAAALLHLGDRGGAEEALKRALYLDRDFALAHYHLGMAALSRGRRDDAVRCFRNVFKSLQQADDGVLIRAGDGATARDLRQYARLQLSDLAEGS